MPAVTFMLFLVGFWFSLFNFKQKNVPMIQIYHSSKLSWLTTGNEIKKELSKVSSSIFDLPNGNPLRQQLSDSKAQLESHVDKKLVLFLINFCFVPHIGPYTCCVPNPPNHENIYSLDQLTKKMLLAQDQFRHRRQH